MLVTHLRAHTHNWEFAASFLGSQVDRATGVIKGVSVITVGPALGHIDRKSGLPVFIDQKTLEQVVACAQQYETGLKVKADHRSGIFATSGYLKNFRIEGDHVRADLHTLSTDENREKLMEMAETIPDTFGLSVAMAGPDETMPDRVLARCDEIFSADLVSDPAANPTGLFSQVDAKKKATLSNTMAKTPSETAGGAAKPGDVKAPENDILGQCRSMLEAAMEASRNEHEQRFARLEAAISALNPKDQQADKKGDGDNDADDQGADGKEEGDDEEADMAVSGDGVTGSNSKAEKPNPKAGDFSALRTEVRELRRTMATLPQKIAKEFAAKIGLSEVTATMAAGADGKSDAAKGTDKAKTFVESVQREFAAGKSKAEAMSLSVKANPEGYREYQAVMEKPEYRIKYERKAAA